MTITTLLTTAGEILTAFLDMATDVVTFLLGNPIVVLLVALGLIGAVIGFVRSVIRH